MASGMSSGLVVAVDSGIARVEMNDRAGRNALGERMVDALTSCLRELGRDPSVRVLVLLGLPEVFCSGAPLELLRRLARGEVAPTDVLLARAALEVPVPVIAAMEGHATGGGLALGLCADLVLIARESRYGASFLDLGFTPGMGITRLLEHVLSPALAHELMLTGEFRRGRDFEGRSGINYVLPRAELRPRALDLAARIAVKPRAALELLKRSLSVRRRQAFEDSHNVEALMHAVTLRDPEVHRMIEEQYVE